MTEKTNLPAQAGKTVLIVEDDHLLLKSLKIKLEKEGYRVLTATNGIEGLQIATTEAVDLILLDILMPEMDGITMIAQLRSLHSMTIPIILLTNLEKVSYPEGISEVLIKSNTSLEKVVEKVKRVLL